MASDSKNNEEKGGGLIDLKNRPTSSGVQLQQNLVNQSQHFSSSKQAGPSSASTAIVPPLINPPKIESNVIKII